MDHNNETQETAGEESAVEASEPKMPIEPRQLGELIAMFKESGVTDFEMKSQGLHLKIAFNRPALAPVAPAAPVAEQAAPAAAVAQPAVAAPAPAPEPEAKKEKPGVLVKSPMVGTFYRSPSPDSSPYVEEGSRVTEETVVCIVEAMKIMNEIKADARGTITEVLVENGHPVEYGQPMFRIVAG